MLHAHMSMRHRCLNMCSPRRVNTSNSTCQQSQAPGSTPWVRPSKPCSGPHGGVPALTRSSPVWSSSAPPTLHYGCRVICPTCTHSALRISHPCLVCKACQSSIPAFSGTPHPWRSSIANTEFATQASGKPLHVDRASSPTTNCLHQQHLAS